MQHNFNFSPLEQLVLAYAKYAHRDQKRKYTNEPYINHCINVAAMCKHFGGTEQMVCAALLHDVLEDTPTTLLELNHFLRSIVDVSHVLIYYTQMYVNDLTEKHTHEAYPHYNRTQRKYLESERLAMSCPESQTIKYCDLIDNTSSIAQYDPGFAKVYLQEKADLLRVMDKGNPKLYQIALELSKQEIT